MNLFVSEIVTPPALLPITVSDTTIARAVVEECEKLILWRAVVRQTRRIRIDGPLPSLIEIEPVNSIISITKWTPEDDAVVIAADSYHSVTRDPTGTLISPLPWAKWPAPERAIGSFASSSAAAASSRLRR